MKLDEYMRSPYWARVHAIIWTRLKDEGVVEIDIDADKELIVAIYKELRQHYRIGISIRAYTTLLGLGENMLYQLKISHEITAC